MIDTFLAHSEKKNCPAQTYKAHIHGVSKRAVQYANKANYYATESSSNLPTLVKSSALLHDLGKLDSNNQVVLAASKNKKQPLPLNHVDAGSVALKNAHNIYAALMVYSHHRGLPDLVYEQCRDSLFLRDETLQARQQTEKNLNQLLRIHYQMFPPEQDTCIQSYRGNQTLYFRMALSCLADADHTDTAISYHQAPEQEVLPKLRAKERLAVLDQYVATLNHNDERSHLRSKMYTLCRDAEISSNFSICDSPVGSGKTTAIMAHLLKQAIKRNARHIFIVLPYTSIIQQSVDVYRKALVLPGENPKEVVAELHSRADFQDYETRYLTSLWRSPIIVTTAVSFFETLASNRPSVLRKLHELPGSMVFIDEAHNALPLKLLPLAWQWMNVLTDEWSCYWVLASGSLVRYWELERLSEIEMAQPTIEELVDAKFRKQLMEYEHNRITFCWKTKPLNRYELIEWVQNTPGPHLLILNTVRNAAVIASDLCEIFGRSQVEHLSTTLTPEDRAKVIEKIKQRLDNPSDTNWTLVATSCVEAGVDFSFRTGFRELSSLLSLLQTAGRINRHGEYTNAQMWSFSLQDDSMLVSNPSLHFSSSVLKNYFEKGIPIVPELSTDAMNNEIIRDDSCLKTIKTLLRAENNMQFPTIANDFKVIESNTVVAVVDKTLAKEIADQTGNWTTLQKKAVTIPKSKINTWHLKEIAKEVYQWTMDYNDFLGYMYGVLKNGK